MQASTTALQKASVRAPRRGSSPRSTRGRSLILAAKITAFGLVLVLCWQPLMTLGLVSRFVLPTPYDTLRSFISLSVNLFTGGYVLEALSITVTEILLGFVIATVLGAILGIIAGDTKFGNDVMMPYIVALNSMPKVAFAPVFIAWLGFGLGPKILLAAFIAFFPVTVNTATGIRSHSKNADYLFKSMRARVAARGPLEGTRAG
jgi:NitT/TauT family transport system permease protein